MCEVFVLISADQDTAKRQLVDRDQLETDFVLLSQISDLSNQLKCNHQVKCYSILNTHPYIICLFFMIETCDSINF